MTISHSIIKEELLALIDRTKIEPTSSESYAEELATIIQNAILSATVKTAGLLDSAGDTLISDTSLQ